VSPQTSRKALATVLADCYASSWSAISRGAVMSAAKGLLSGDFAEITARIARANYGFTYETAWVDGKYDEQDKYWSSVQHRLLARNQIWWFLKKVSLVLRDEGHVRGCELV